MISTLHQIFIIQVIRLRIMWVGHVAHVGERSTYRVLVGKLGGKRPLGIPKHRWEDNVKMNIKEVVVGGIDWIDLAEDKDRWQSLVNAVMNLCIP